MEAFVRVADSINDVYPLPELTPDGKQLTPSSLHWHWRRGKYGASMGKSGSVGGDGAGPRRTAIPGG